MGYRRGLVAGALLAALAAATAKGQETPPPIDPNDAYFRRALARMNALPQPPSFTYAAQVLTDGGTIDMRSAGGENVAALFIAGGKAGDEGTDDSRLTFSFDNRSLATYLVGGATALGAFPGPIFNPTWNSAFRWMQSRRFFADVTTVASTLSPAPVPTQLKTIAIVSRAPELSYHVVRAVRATCVNHDLGWELIVVPVSDPENHPLSSVVVDDRSGLLCAMRFEETMRGAPPSTATHGAIELQFDRIDGLYVVTAESIAMHLGVPGPIQGMSATIAFRQFNSQ